MAAGADVTGYEAKPPVMVVSLFHVSLPVFLGGVSVEQVLAEDKTNSTTVSAEILALR